MKRIRITKIMALIAVVAIAGLSQACDDGQMDVPGGANLSVSPYVAITAEPMTVNKGGSTTLKWTVANADSVKITGTSASGEFSFNSDTIDMTDQTDGSLVVDGISATTTFVITAQGAVVDASISNPADHPYFQNGSKSQHYALARSGQITLPEPEPNPDIAPMEVSDSVTVTVVDEGPLTASLTAMPERIQRGESSTLTCTVTPTSATISVMASSGETIDMGENCEAVVTPTETTVYTLTATDASGAQATSMATVIVEDMSIDYDGSGITANGEHPQAEVDTFDAPVTIKYDIVPSDIPVSVVANKQVSCMPELPANQVLEGGTGTSECNLTENTVFTLKAHLGEQVIDVKAVSVISAAASGRVRITAQPWAFEGENVTVTVEPATSADATRLQKIRIKGLTTIERTITDSTPIVETITVPMIGISVEVFSKGIAESTYDKKVVQALPLLPIGVIGEPITEVMFDPNDMTRSYYGLMNDLAAQGKEFSATTVKLHRNQNLSADPSANGALEIDLGYLMTVFDQEFVDIFLNGSQQFVNDFRKYPVSAIAVKQDEPTTIFAGTYGGITFSRDNGETWDLLWSPLLVTAVKKNDPGTHESCAGETALGSTSKHPGDLISLVNICDIVLDGERVIAASDNGTIVINDIAMAQSAPFAEDNVRYNVPLSDNYEAAGVPMFTHVVNDLELVESGSSKKIFAAVAQGNRSITKGDVRGVFMSSSADGQLGDSWQAFGDLAVDTYAVVADMHDGEATKLYAATAEGIYVSDIAAANWSKLDSTNEPVFSLADDPFSTGVIMAGLSSGAEITRDAGQNWNDLHTGGVEEAGKVIAIAMAADVDSQSGLVNYRAAFGTSGGFLAGKVMVESAAQEVTTETPEDDGSEDDGSDDDIILMKPQMRDKFEALREYMFGSEE